MHRHYTKDHLKLVNICVLSDYYHDREEYLELVDRAFGVLLPVADTARERGRDLAELVDDAISETMTGKVVRLQSKKIFDASVMLLNYGTSVVPFGDTWRQVMDNARRQVQGCIKCQKGYSEYISLIDDGLAERGQQLKESDNGLDFLNIYSAEKRLNL